LKAQQESTPRGQVWAYGLGRGLGPKPSVLPLTLGWPAGGQQRADNGPWPGQNGLADAGARLADKTSRSAAKRRFGL